MREKRYGLIFIMLLFGGSVCFPGKTAAQPDEYASLKDAPSLNPPRVELPEPEPPA